MRKWLKQCDTFLYSFVWGRKILPNEGKEKSSFVLSKSKKRFWLGSQATLSVINKSSLSVKSYPLFHVESKGGHLWKSPFLVSPIVCELTRNESNAKFRDYVILGRWMGDELKETSSSKDILLEQEIEGKEIKELIFPSSHRRCNPMYERCAVKVSKRVDCVFFNVLTTCQLRCLHEIIN